MIIGSNSLSHQKHASGSNLPIYRDGFGSNYLTIKQPDHKLLQTLKLTIDDLKCLRFTFYNEWILLKIQPKIISITLILLKASDSLLQIHNQSE